ncbi:hypothetical protein E2562_009221 [Oryza meyeriana var. granulata]|uniref:Uncharacterized protein n=1 Tax=Oryza meyeriana var. granulata TaxID=110450 RepID=A0A6G1D253_9ORYZ|nr:hypothetical protein E2562_009221 [Oryza meyeriana var. granulata]
MIAIGLFLMVVFVLGFCAVREGDECLYGCYFIGLLIVILALLGFVIFGYVAVGGIDIGPIRVREYNLKDYSGWLRGRMADPRYWATTSRCLHDKNVCNGMTQLVRDPDTGIYVPELSPFEKWAKEHRFMEEYVHVMSPIEVDEKLY